MISGIILITENIGFTFMTFVVFLYVAESIIDLYDRRRAKHGMH